MYSTVLYSMKPINNNNMNNLFLTYLYVHTANNSPFTYSQKDFSQASILTSNINLIFPKQYYNILSDIL